VCDQLDSPAPRRPGEAGYLSKARGDTSLVSAHAQAVYERGVTSVNFADRPDLTVKAGLSYRCPVECETTAQRKNEVQVDEDGEDLRVDHEPALDLSALPE
jgi:hypothetical protein